MYTCIFDAALGSVARLKIMNYGMTAGKALMALSNSFYLLRVLPLSCQQLFSLPTWALMLQDEIPKHHGTTTGAGCLAIKMTM